MDWRDYIYSNPGIGGGKPIIRGTRLKVAFMVSLMRAGWTDEDLLESYPGVTIGDLEACRDFAAEKENARRAT